MSAADVAWLPLSRVQFFPIILEPVFRTKLTAANDKRRGHPVRARSLAAVHAGIADREAYETSPHD